MLIEKAGLRPGIIPTQLLSYFAPAGLQLVAVHVASICLRKLQALTMPYRELICAKLAVACGSRKQQRDQKLFENFKKSDKTNDK